MKFCTRCGFPLGTRPGLLVVDGVCQACLNQDAKKTIDWKKRQQWLTDTIKSSGSAHYNAIIAVSGGKDSHAIVKRLVENHGLKNALLVNVTDEFSHTKAGTYNLDNLAKWANFDFITYRCKPKDFVENTKRDFENELHPLKWIEEKIYSVPIELAKAYGCKLVFFGENSAFEYGTSPELDILHPLSTSSRQVIFMGAIYPYSIKDSLEQAKEIGFKDLDDFGEWKRQGSIEQYTQIDSVGYLMQIFTKFVKYGFQRVADIACRMVREGTLTKDKARELIDKYDHICDPESKADFCRAIGITENRFDKIVARHANQAIVEFKDNQWKVRNG